jgi:uncharacterized protein (DUF58 family)
VTDQRRFLDPEVISKLASMDIKARLVVEGFVTGLHKSPYKGFSVEFAEHRQYMEGDPIKHIDWKVYAKTDRFYIKEFEEETNLKAYILLDVSGSMGFKSNGISKLEYGSYLAASLSYLMLKQQDSVGLLLFDDKIREYIPPRSSPIHLHILFNSLQNARAEKETNLGRILHELANRIRRRGLVILISDLFDEPMSIIPGLKHFRHKKHEVVVFHVLDPSEVEFPFRGTANFKDMETGETIPTDAWRIREEYTSLADNWIREFKRQCAESRVDYVSMLTSTPFDRALFSYLEKRKRLG